MLRWALVGGGGSAMIGPVHRGAALASGRFAMAAAAPSSRPDVAEASAREWGVEGFASWRDLVVAAPRLGLQAVSIATPNHLHAEQATAFLRAGVPVICDKPLAGTLAEAGAVARAARETGVPLVVTYNYSAYPAVRDARRLVAEGALGRVHRVAVEFLQDGRLTAPKPRGWRHRPEMAGAGGTLSDLGTHALHLAEFVTGRRVESLACDLAHVSGGPLDDDASALLRFDDGLLGSLWVSQASPGTRPGLRLRVIGTEKSLDWWLAAPDTLMVAGLKEQLAPPVPASPERWAAAFHEAFTALYIDAAERIGGAESLAPGVEEGVRGLAFVEAALRSGGEWVRL